jgi:hypothetical protein
MSNQIQIISPYWLHGTWVFNDDRVGLLQEPFVSGVPEMIDDLVADIPDARSGFRLLFSSVPFRVFSGSSLGFEKSSAATGTRPTSHHSKAGFARHCSGTSIRHRLSCS